MRVWLLSCAVPALLAVTSSKPGKAPVAPACKRHCATKTADHIVLCTQVYATRQE